MKKLAFVVSIAIVGSGCALDERLLGVDKYGDSSAPDSSGEMVMAESVPATTGASDCTQVLTSVYRLEAKETGGAPLFLNAPAPSPSPEPSPSPSASPAPASQEDTWVPCASPNDLVEKLEPNQGGEVEVWLRRLPWQDPDLMEQRGHDLFPRLYTIEMEKDDTSVVFSCDSGVMSSDRRYQLLRCSNPQFLLQKVDANWYSEDFDYLSLRSFTVLNAECGAWVTYSRTSESVSYCMGEGNPNEHDWKEIFLYERLIQGVFPIK